ncbi:hypothetical protein [Salininema proteolyticum]|uniref:Ricin B lectin domain-containing protein n=1 Tax=Salininema proteolyticum TaxID=1607685 RepID=A0ABV8U1E3_9ACTN
MDRHIRRIAAFALAAFLAAPAGSARAETPVPEGPVPEGVALEIFPKDHPGLPIAWSDEGVLFSEEGDRWRFEGVTAEGLSFTVERIVHDESALCLAPGVVGGDETAARLDDCGETAPWKIEPDWTKDPVDLRVIDSRDRRLGPGDDGVRSEGKVVLRDATGLHDEEWRIRFPHSGRDDAAEEADAEPAAAAAAPLPVTGTSRLIPIFAVVVAFIVGAVAFIATRRPEREHFQ